MRSLILVILIVAIVQGCSYPASQVRIPDNRPSIGIENAPDGAILFVDGLNMGPANQYNGIGKALLIEPGTHKIEVVDKERTILSEKVFLGASELKIFRVHHEAE